MRDLKRKIQEIIDARLDGVWTAAIGIVTKAGTRNVDVQIKNKILVDGSEEDFPIIKSVPVLFPRTANFSLVSPLEVGDTVLLIFTKYNSKGLLDSSGAILSRDMRQFSLNDCICIPGFFLSSDELPEVSEGEAVLHHKSGSLIKFTDDEVNVTHKSNSKIRITDDEMILEHKSGSFIKFKSDGSIEIYTTRLDINKK